MMKQNQKYNVKIGNKSLLESKNNEAIEEINKLES